MEYPGDIYTSATHCALAVNSGQILRTSEGRAAASRGPRLLSARLLALPHVIVKPRKNDK